jgi:hypothetical protein
VGDDNIESAVDFHNWHSFWKNSDGRWEQRGNDGTELTLAQVLKAVNLSNERYQEYMQLLSKAGGERFTYCDNVRDGEVMDVLVHRTGLAVSGCSAEMHWTPDARTPVDVSGNDYSTIVEAGDGWRLVYECT